MGGHFFLSYSPDDGTDFALKLADAVATGPPPYPVWVDQRDLRPGEDWDEQIVEALRTCRGVLFVMTNESVESEAECKKEWVRALKYKKPVIPLRLHDTAELPYRLEPREFIDMSDFGSGIARLRQYLATTSTPEGVLRELNTRRDDADRQLSQTAPQRRPVVEREITELQRRIEETQGLIENPAEKQRQTAERIEAALERERQPERPEAATPARARFVNPPPLTAPRYFQDRHQETGLLADYLTTPDLRLVSVTGRGGLGKTSMVCRLLKALEAGRLPDDTPALGAERVDVPRIDGIVYLSPTGGHPVSFPNLFADLCRLVPEETAAVLTDRYKDPEQTPTRLMYALLEAFPTGCTVLLLDNFEDHIEVGTGAIADPALDEALRALVTAPEHGVKVILTTRVAPRALLLTQPSRQRRLGLDEGLGSPYAENVLRASDPDGSLGLKDAPPEHLAAARERTRGYPRALEALAAILAVDRDTTLQELLAETAQLPDNVVEALVGEAYSRLDSLAQQVIQALAVYPTPVAPVAVDYLLQPYRATIDAAPVLSRLVSMQFVRRDGGRYYLHQVDRGYALGRLPEDPAADRPAGPADDDLPQFARRALQQRGADYYAQTRTPRETWKSIEDLAPQLAEYELRSQAGDFDNAASVLLEVDFEYLILWGHYRYTIELHQRLQGNLSDPWMRSATLTNLGSCYLNLSIYPLAIEHYEQALAINRDIGNRYGEAVGLGNLAACHYMQDDYPRALDYYRQAMTITRDLGDRQGEASSLAGLAGCYNAQGDYARALDHYRQALTINRDVGDRLGEAGNLGGLASCYAAQGDYPLAIDHYERALTINRHIGNRRGEAGDISGLADCYSVQGDYPRAMNHYQQALSINRDIGNRQGEANGISGLADCEYMQDEYARAVDHYQQALTINRDIGDRQGEANNLGGLAGCYYMQDEYAHAVDHYRQALTINRDIENRQGEANNLSGLADCYFVQSDYARAIGHYQQALTINHAIGNRQGEAGNRSGLASCHSAQGDYARAMDHYQQALAINRDIGAPQGEAANLSGLAGCYSLQGDYARAMDHYQQALTINRDIGDRQGETNNLTGLADCYTSQGDYARAIDHYRQALTINRAIGNRQGEANSLAGLADCYPSRGDYARAMDHYQQALTINRAIGNRQGEAGSLLGLAGCHADLERSEVALELTREALTIVRDIGDQAGEAGALNWLGAVHTDERNWQSATDSCLSAVKIADMIGNRPLQSNARLTLATARLLAGDLDGAREAAQASAGYHHAESWFQANLVLGIALLRQGSPAAARSALTAAAEAAEDRLTRTAEDCAALETKALALAALSVIDGQDRSDEAKRLSDAAHAIVTAPQVRTRYRWLLEAISEAG